ncbi:hypothetical protein THSYN_25100 [Candidatus Thiodictyon syntrophicum]|jgi:ADP-ribose pyrophosphatase YjhB (NUDIX family)|uniref:Nudix hydrolase domain-containing protein n=2 Tax=Candidatus Thiodictyon syntrophicum TaxID=1166950 RepID=A0A2K8UED2_9GAMM|nr:hypothetical protein THSYN_25100 [Candidatus Thiodictyon syntrophicum]
MFAISVENLSKSSLVGHNAAKGERYPALRDTLARNAPLPLSQAPQPKRLESKASALARAKAQALDSRQRRRGRRVRLNLLLTAPTTPLAKLRHLTRMRIAREEYERIIRVFPRVCVDILLTDTAGRVLLLQRTNQPAIGQWWFPGGRVHIGETRLQAAHRKLREECVLPAGELTELGSFDLFFEIDQTTYHDVTILFRRQVESGTEILIDAQASAFGWFYPEQCRDLGLNRYVIDNILVHAQPALNPASWSPRSEPCLIA